MRFQRELTAAVLIPAVVAVVVAGPVWSFALLAGVAGVIALAEFLAMLSGTGLWVPRVGAFATFLPLIVAAALRSNDLFLVAAGAAVFVLPTLVLFSGAPESALLPSSASSVFATLYVGAGTASFVGLRHLGWKPVVLLLAVVWAGDSAAYYVGRTWGRRRLAPVVSPKKTWEGLWGQIAGGALAGAAFAALLVSPGQAPWGAGIGVGVSVVAVVGDLVESTFKRSLSVKDSGVLLPGHGGFLDRLDSLLYAAPFLLLALDRIPGGVLR